MSEIFLNNLLDTLYIKSVAVVLLCLTLSFKSLAQLQYNTEIVGSDLSKAEVIAKINRWAVNNPRHYSSVSQNPDSSGLVINGVTSVFLDYWTRYKRSTEQENYNYQLLVRVIDNKYYVTLRNYISTKPNSQMITTLPERLDYIDHNRSIGRKQKKVLTKYAYDEYGQLEKHSALVFSQIEKLIQ